MNEGGLDRLCIAIVQRAVQDYLKALRVTYRHAGATGKRKYYCRAAERMIEDCERFFLNDCDYFVDIDGKWLMQEVKNKSRDFTFYVRREEEK